MKKVLGTDGLPLWQLYEDFKSKAIERPDWQRGRAWLDEKRDKWIKDILAIANSGDNYGGGSIAGMVVVFSIAVIVDGQEVGYLGKWLNDGLQRLSALADWIDEMLDGKKMTKVELITTLSRVRIVVQSVGYSSKAEAFDDFFPPSKFILGRVYQIHGQMSMTKEELMTTLSRKIKSLHYISVM